MLTKKVYLILSLPVAAILIIAVWAIPSYQNYAEYSPRLESPNSSDWGGAAAYYHSIRGNQFTGEVSTHDLMQAEAAMATVRQKRTAGIGWSEVGPDNIGGRTRAILIDKNNSDRLFAGSVSGGLFVSENAAGNWRPVNDLSRSAIVASLAQSSNGDVWVGTGSDFDKSANAAGVLFPGKGVFVSRDQGNTFQQLASTLPGDTNSIQETWVTVNRIAIDTNKSNRIYAATHRGLRVSDDDGETWYNPICLDPGCQVRATGIGQEVAVGEDGSVLAVVGGITYRSVSGDDGSFINVSGNGLPPANRIVLAIAPSNQDYVYAIAADGAGFLRGIYQSIDQGENWELILQPIPDYFEPLRNTGLEYGQGLYDLALAVYPNDPEKILIGGVQLWRWDGNLTRIAGEFVSPFSPLYVHADKHFFLFDQKDANILYIGTDGGVAKSEDGGNTFTTNNKGYNVTQFYGIAYSADGIVFGGTQDNGTVAVPDLNPLDPQVGYSISGGDGFDCESSQITNIIFTTIYSSQLFRGVVNDLNNIPLNRICEPYCDDPGAPFYTAMRLWESTDDPFSKDSVVFMNDTTELVLSVGNGINKTFSGTVVPVQKAGAIVPGSLRFQSGFSRLEDMDADGNLTGDGSGTIDYETGAYEITFSEAPPTNQLVQAYFSTHFNPNSVLQLVSNSNDLPFAHRLESALKPGASVLVRDPVQSLLALAVNGNVALARGALDVAKLPTWIEMEPATGVPRTLEFSADGNHLFLGTASGSVIRISGLRQLYHEEDRSLLTQTQIFSSSQAVTGLAIHPTDPEQLIITLGNYGNSDYVYLLNQAISATGPFDAGAVSVQGQLPPMPVYDAEFDVRQPSGVLIGTDYGLFATEDIQGTAVQWVHESEELGHWPIYDIRQQKLQGDQITNYGIFYIGTHGRGLWKSGLYPVGIEPQQPNPESTSPLSELVIFPNPASEVTRLTVQSKEAGTGEIALMDIQGRIVRVLQQPLNAGNNSFELDLKGLVPGIYVVRITTGQRSVTGKMVVQ